MTNIYWHWVGQCSKTVSLHSCTVNQNSSVTSRWMSNMPPALSQLVDSYLHSRRLLKADLSD